MFFDFQQMLTKNSFFKCLKASRVSVRRLVALLVGAHELDDSLEAGLQIVFGDENVLCVGAVVVEAALGRPAGPGPVRGVEPPLTRTVFWTSR